MSDVKWIKIVTDIFDNRKIKQIEQMPDSDALLVIWFKLLSLAGKINDNGYLTFTDELPYTDRLLSTEFNKPIATIQLALKTFQEFQMIEVIDDIIKISNWEKYQNVDGMEKIREQTRKRVAKHRERKKLECNANSNVTVTQGNATDKEEDIDKDIEKKNRGTFVPPTVDEVKAYCQERNNGVDPQTFVNFYQSKGWMVGKNKMKDWKAAVRTWERNRNDKPDKVGFEVSV